MDQSNDRSINQSINQLIFSTYLPLVNFLTRCVIWVTTSTQSSLSLKLKFWLWRASEWMRCFFFPIGTNKRFGYCSSLIDFVLFVCLCLWVNEMKRSLASLLPTAPKKKKKKKRLHQQNANWKSSFLSNPKTEEEERSKNNWRNKQTNKQQTMWIYREESFLETDVKAFRKKRQKRRITIYDNLLSLEFWIFCFFFFFCSHKKCNKNAGKEKRDEKLFEERREEEEEAFEERRDERRRDEANRHTVWRREREREREREKRRDEEKRRKETKGDETKRTGTR